MSENTDKDCASIMYEALLSIMQSEISGPEARNIAAKAIENVFLKQTEHATTVKKPKKIVGRQIVVDVE